MTQAVATADATGGKPLDNPEQWDRALQEAERRHQAGGRRLILPVLLIGYLTLLAVNIVLPFVIVPTLKSGGEVTQIRDLMLAVSSVLQGSSSGS